MTAHKKTVLFRSAGARIGQSNRSGDFPSHSGSRTNVATAEEAFGPLSDAVIVTMGAGDADRAATPARRPQRRGGMALTSALLALLGAAGTTLFTGAAYVNDAGGADGWTRARRESALAVAVRQGDVTTARRLLSYGANPNARIGADGPTLLCAAISTGQVETRQRAALVDTLLTARAAPDLPSAPTKRTPLMDAAFRGDDNVARLLLLRGANANRRDADGRTPLVWLAKGRIARNDYQNNAALDAARVLLEANNEAESAPTISPGRATPPACRAVLPRDQSDPLGASEALLIATSHGDKPLATLLLEEKSGSLSRASLNHAATLAQKRGDAALARQLRRRATSAL